MIIGLCQDSTPRSNWPYRQDWIVAEIRPSTTYKNHVWVRGINLSCKPNEYGREFSWTVPLPLSWRYDLSAVCE